MVLKARACTFVCANASIPKVEEKDWNGAMTKGEGRAVQEVGGGRLSEHRQATAAQVSRGQEGEVRAESLRVQVSAA